MSDIRESNIPINNQKLSNTRSSNKSDYKSSNNNSNSKYIKSNKSFESEFEN